MMNCGRCRSLFHYRRTKFQISLGQTRAFGWQGFCLPGDIWQCLVIFVVISTTRSGSGATGISAVFKGHHLSFYNSTETRLTKYGKRVEIRTAQYPFPMQRAGRRDNLETKRDFLHVSPDWRRQRSRKRLVDLARFATRLQEALRSTNEHQIYEIRQMLVLVRDCYNKYAVIYNGLYDERFSQLGDWRDQQIQG